jgi:hypothetical protein
MITNVSLVWICVAELNNACVVQSYEPSWRHATQYLDIHGYQVDIARSKISMAAMFTSQFPYKQ